MLKAEIVKIANELSQVMINDDEFQTRLEDAISGMTANEFSAMVELGDLYCAVRDGITEREIARKQQIEILNRLEI